MKTLLGVLVVSIVTSLVAQSSMRYHIARVLQLGGDGSWDYIVPDAPSHRLFIGRQNRVMVVDENDGTLLGEVMGIQGGRNVDRHPSGQSGPVSRDSNAADGAGVTQHGTRPGDASHLCRGREVRSSPRGTRSWSGAARLVLGARHRTPVV